MAGLRPAARMNRRRPRSRELIADVEHKAVNGSKRAVRRIADERVAVCRVRRNNPGKAAARERPVNPRGGLTVIQLRQLNNGYG